MTFLVVRTCPCAEQKSHTPKVVLNASFLGSSPVHKRKSLLPQDFGSMLAHQSCLWLPLRFYRRVFPQQTACIPTRSPPILIPAAVPPAAVCLVGWHRRVWHGMGTYSHNAHHPCSPSPLPTYSWKENQPNRYQHGKKAALQLSAQYNFRSNGWSSHSIFSGPFIS